MSLNLNTVTLAGNLCRDPELKHTTSGKAVVQFTVAVNDRDDATFVDCEAWEKTAENVAEYLHKGDGVGVEGRLKMDRWEKDGQKRSKLKVVAFRVQFGDKAKAAGDKAKAAGDPQPFDEDEVPF